MKRRDLLELEDIGITDEIRNLAYGDRGEERMREYYYGVDIYTAYKIHSYMTAREMDGIMKLEIYRGEDIRKHDEEPEYIIFLSAKENKYDTYIPKERKWSRAKLENLRMRGSNYRNTYSRMLWISDEDEDAVRRYINETGGVVSAIGTWQTNAMHRKEIQQIDRVMNQITETPADFGQWVREEAFWKQQYIFYSAQEGKIYCTACKQTIKTKMRSVHNKYITCPACGRKVMGKSWKKQKNLRDDQTAALIQRIPEGLIVRIFFCRKHHEIRNNWKEKVYISETDRQLYSLNMNLIRDYEYANFKQTGKLRWCRSHYAYNAVQAVVYPGNIREVREGTKIADVEIETMLKREKGEKVEIRKLLNPGDATKYLIRVGLTRLAIEDIQAVRTRIYRKGRTAQEVLGINGDRINRLKNLNGGGVTLGWLQYEEETGIKIRQRTLERLEDKGINRRDLDTALQCGVTPERALNYIEKQTRAQSDTLIEWKDYLKMAKEERMDVYDDIVRMPRKLHRRHNELVELKNKKEDEKKLKEYRKYDRQIRKRLGEAAIYLWEDKNYMIVPAAKCEELMREGRTLHHCVGTNDTYMKRMAAGISWILFLRHKEHPEEPYYTIEISMKDDEILQWYSEYDRKPGRGMIEKVLMRFRKSVKRKRMKEAKKEIA